METKNYVIGGIVSREILSKSVPFLAQQSSGFSWECTKDDMSTFLLAGGNDFTSLESAKHVLIVAGHISYSGKGAHSLEALAEIEKSYIRNGRLPIEHLEGSFAIIILNKPKATMTIYRNIMGLPPMYYCQTRKGVVFSDSLSILAQIISEISIGELELHPDQSLAHFLFGRVYGRDTLYKGIFRIQCGEQVAFSRNSLGCLQLQTFDSMIGQKVKNCVKCLENTFQQIINEYAVIYAQIGNFLSGGIDSSYIQAHLTNRMGCDLPTFSVDLVHPSWRTEHEYAESGSKFFRSNHIFVKVDPLAYASLLTETTGILGKPIFNAQTAFVPELSRVAVQNTSVCLCGMAGDTLFGTEEGRHIDIALQINRLVPWNFLRQAIMQIPELIGKTRFSFDRLQTLQGCMELDLVKESSPTHPLNISRRVNLELVSDIFGRSKVTSALSERRALLNQYQSTGSLKERLHSLYILGVHQTCERFYQLTSHSGLKLIFPYLDSRMIRAALSMDANQRFPFMHTKKVLKDALGKYMPNEFLYRKKSAWGVPLYEWLGRGGVLFPLVERVNEYPFLGSRTRVARRIQDWFLWSLLTFDLWHKLFIDQGPSAQVCDH